MPGVTATTNTLDDVLREVAEALASAFWDWQSKLPTPRTLDALREDAEVAEWLAEATFAAVEARASAAKAP